MSKVWVWRLLALIVVVLLLSVAMAFNIGSRKIEQQNLNARQSEILQEAKDITVAKAREIAEKIIQIRQERMQLEIDALKKEVVELKKEKK